MDRSTCFPSRVRNTPGGEVSVDFKRLIDTTASRSVILVRIVVGWVFFSEGIQKFLYPAENGAGRFARNGIPSPDDMGPIVGVVEVGKGDLILIGLLTTLHAIP